MSGKWEYHKEVLLFKSRQGSAVVPAWSAWLTKPNKKALWKYEIWKSNSRRFNVSAIPHLQRLRNKQAELKKKEFRKLKFKTLSPVTLASSEDI